ncbi:HNH endonuclease [Vibrio fluvialis]|nr:HNH endonuclease [Vibrio fluvialis]MBY8102123.1 HNH endonuclease [Vibrio fluvialis]
MPVSEKLKRVIWSKAAGKCSICREDLLLDGSGEDLTHLVGEVAHIVAEKSDGPRGESVLDLNSRNSESNLLLLCLTHHKVIDDDPTSYTVDRLLEIKAAHENWVSHSLASNPVWDTKLHQMYYLNVPRLSLLCSRYGYSLDLSRYGRILALHELGWELNGLMGGFSKLLSAVELKAVPIETAITQPDCMRGTYVSFDCRFRTKNISMPDSPSGYNTVFRGDLKSDPHIYTKIGDYKVIAYIDRRWITTTTAFCQFRPSSGQNDFAGIAFVNSVDTVAKTVSITPYVIGMPSNDFIEAFYGGL